MPKEFYRHRLPQAGLSIERNTPSVPQDDRFRVLLKGTIVASFRSLKKAEARFNDLKRELGVPQPKKQQQRKDLAGKEHIERLLDDAEAYWSESHRYRQRGGRGGRGGVQM